MVGFSLALLAVAKPWTYWLAPPLLVLTVLYSIGLTVVYSRKVVVPQWQRRKRAHPSGHGSGAPRDTRQPRDEGRRTLSDQSLERPGEGKGTARGSLRVYIGAAPGVGKTYAMLNDGWRRHRRSTDVVIGYVETHKRPLTEAQIRDLEIVPRKKLAYRGQFEEMDVDAILARKPDLALVDELAHTNVPGSRNQKRWQDVEELLDAGIDVITTLNIQHLESLGDLIESITGIRPAGDRSGRGRAPSG